MHIAGNAFFFFSSTAFQFIVVTSTPQTDFSWRSDHGFLFLLPGCPAVGAGRPVFWRELAAVVLQPGVADPSGPVLSLRAHANGGFPFSHQAAVGQRI